MHTTTVAPSGLSALLADFRMPGNAYRGMPFWAWNGKLEPEELRRQIREMHAMGLGGFFMHSRVGLATPYLSDEWFACIDACIDEARQLDMQAWLYDEDRWPSGAAGGLITKDPRYQARSLVMRELESVEQLTWTDETLAIFVARVKGSQATGVRRLLPEKPLKKLKTGETILQFVVRVDEPSSWYNDATYLDTLNHEAVQRFIEVTHEAYRERCGAHFGGVVPGMFTDEPNYGHWMHTSANGETVAPWTGCLPAVFQARYGYDLIPHLPEIFLNCDGKAFTPARLNFHDCLTHLFVDAFSRQVGEWCTQNTLTFTGHVLLEDKLSDQTRVVGSAMRFYEHMQAPGMDLLTQYWRVYDTAKQVSSVARQCGRTWRLTETYGCTGWDFPFAGHKALGDWQVACGINLRCQHLFWYTMEGEAKRDYPASIGYQSPWWELYPTVEDYFARVHRVMTQGKEVRDLLVIHPIESMWAISTRSFNTDPAVRALDNALGEMRDTLMMEHIDFDYGDEEMLSRLGDVKRRHGATLCVGQADYRVVLVPPLRTMRATTLKLLRKFAAAGGTVVFAGEPAAFVDGKPSLAVQEFARTCAKAPARGKGLVEGVNAARRLHITDGAGKEIGAALYLLREDADAYYLFICNTGHDPRKRGYVPNDDPRVALRTAAFPTVLIRGFTECKGAPVELDPRTGALCLADAKHTAKGWEIATSLPALGSRLFVLPKKKTAVRAPARKPLADQRATTLNPRRWPVTLSDPNVLVLDRPRYRINTGRLHKADEILRIDRAVRAGLGLAPRGGAMVQPWANEKATQPKRATVTLVYSIQMAIVPANPLRLALERPETFALEVNGQKIALGVTGWWTDRSLRTLALDPALFRLGRNEVTLECAYDEAHPGLEPAYLLGDFGVRVHGTSTTLISATDALKPGDWTAQGLPFYGGNVRYATTLHRPRMRKGDRLIMHVPAYAGTAVRVLVDGQSAGVVGWDPHEVDITELATASTTTLEIEVVGHRRNSHGPLHWTNAYPVWVGPDGFVTEDTEWSDAYQLVPCGLLGPVELIIRR